MPLPLAQVVLPTLTLVIISLVVGASVYMALRAFEHRYVVESVGCCVIGTAAMLLSIAAYNASMLALVCSVALPVSALGAHFHRKSGGGSPDWLHAFLLALFAVLASGAIELSLIAWRNIRLPNFGFLHPLFTICVLYGILAAPIALTPFLLWAGENFRLRPGAERELRDGDK